MSNKSAIVIIEDDLDDQHLIGEALQALHLPNSLHFFDRGDKALAFLLDYNGPPFLILCDMNMPGLNGLELLEKMNKDNRLQNKKAPFVFFSTSATPMAIQKAYSFFAQGFFVKPHTIADTKRLMQTIINYWQVCQHPAVTV